jgi:hypothetical protein
MTDSLRRLLESVGAAFDTSQLSLYDYDEQGDCFDLIYFLGFPENSRSDLHRRILRPGLRRALATRDHYLFDETGTILAIPLYFLDTLEAVLLLDSARGWPAAEPTTTKARLVSRFLGLFMSSRRLPVNVEREMATTGDLARAREVQLSYLPQATLSTKYFQIFGHNRSSAIVGGDYFDYFQPGPTTVQGVVADACGHGMAAALIMSTFRGLLHAEAPSGEGIVSAFERINRRLSRGGGRLQYLTGVFFEFHEAQRELRYLNAGHFDPVLMRADGTVGRLAGGGPPLGMFQESSYPLGTAHPGPGDLLVLFSDGLVELADPAGEFFEVDRIVAAVRARRHLGLDEISAGVLDTATKFRGRDDLADDLTLFLMRFS